MKNNDSLATAVGVLTTYLTLLDRPLTVVLSAPFVSMLTLIVSGFLGWSGTMLAKYIAAQVAVRFDVKLLKRLLKLEDE